MIWNTSSKGRSRASAGGQPVSLAATGFRKETRPWRSVAITASPMLVRVVENRWRLAASSDRVRCRRSTMRPATMPKARKQAIITRRM